MAEVPVIQILEKEKFFTQNIVPLPNAVPYPPLTAPSSLRLRTKVMCLTTNNVSYARLGFLFGWWDVHPLPPSTPAQYNDPAKYGRTNCWGFAEVLESTVASVPKGAYLWGYLPLGTLAQDVTVEEGAIPGQVFVTNDYRKGVMAIYNRYFVHPASLKDEIEKKADSLAYDAIVRVMFETSYLLNRYVFASDPKETVYPGMDPKAQWSPAQADITGATVIFLAPGSKAALAFAYELRNARGGAQVKKIVGATSESSRNFVEGTESYDDVILTSESSASVLSKLQVGAKDKVVLVDFGGRAGVGAKWAAEFKRTHNNFLMIGVGSEISESSQEDALKALTAKGSSAIGINANDMRIRAMEKVGEKKYFDNLAAAWDSFKKVGIKGLKITWGDNMEDVKKGWDKLCRGEATPEEGLAYRL
ncbi:hypothetical protein JX266_000290 [Neoarthrinium moseri]|nr:hypothetical protein JX266_000290 [Neoarthrinium moseri]